jgi:hypothetical protein
MATYEHAQVETIAERPRGVYSFGWVAESIGGAVTVILAIVGLSGVHPLALAGVGSIALGIALMFEGAFIARRYSELLAGVQPATPAPRTLGRGVPAESLAGLAGIILGILALLRVDPGVLLSTTAIAFGGALLLGSGATSDLKLLRLANENAGGVALQRLAKEAISVVSGGEVLVGVAAIVLGILGVLTIAPFTMALVALLCVSASILMAGTAISTRLTGSRRA